MKLKKKSSPLKLLSQSQPNFAEMILGWSPFKIVSVSAVLYPRWPPLLKIEISSNGRELLPSLGVRRLSSVVLSVVCKLFTFQASSPKPLGRLEPNLAGMFLGWSSTKLQFFVPVGYSIWLPRPIICSDWLKFQRSSSLKLMN